MKWCLALVVLLAGCADAAPAEPTVGKYTQTWTRAYGDTHCGHWLEEMDAHQRFVMGGDMLLRAQRLDRPDAPLPPDHLIRSFQADMTALCQADLGYPLEERGMAAIATLAYIDGDYGPAQP